MVLDAEFLVGAVGHALLARVAPRERRLDAVGGVVCEGEADGAGGGDRQQMRIADTVLADGFLQLVGQARGEIAARKVKVLVEHREWATFLRKLHGRRVGAVTHIFGNLRRHRPRGLGVIAKSEHGKRITQPREAESHATLRFRLRILGFQRPWRDVEHVVEHADRTRRPRGRTIRNRIRRLPRTAAARNSVRSIDPRQQQPYAGSGCSLQGFVDSIVSQ